MIDLWLYIQIRHLHAINQSVTALGTWEYNIWLLVDLKESVKASPYWSKKESVLHQSLSERL